MAEGFLLWCKLIFCTIYIDLWAIVHLSVVFFSSSRFFSSNLIVAFWVTQNWITDFKYLYRRFEKGSEVGASSPTSFPVSNYDPIF